MVTLSSAVVCCSLDFFTCVQDSVFNAMFSACVINFLLDLYYVHNVHSVSESLQSVVGYQSVVCVYHIIGLLCRVTNN
jgi:hypothetical protein